MIIYITGPMSGLPDLNFPAFHAAAAKLRAEGHTVINPAEINADVAGQRPWDFYMRADIVELTKCEAIYLLNGWRDSKGALLEFTIAVGLDMEIFSQP